MAFPWVSLCGYFQFPIVLFLFYSNASNLSTVCPAGASSQTDHEDGCFVWLLPINPPPPQTSRKFFSPAEPLSLNASRLLYFLHINMSPGSATAGCQLNATPGLRKHHLPPLTDSLSLLTQKKFRNLIHLSSRLWLWISSSGDGEAHSDAV